MENQCREITKINKVSNLTQRVATVLKVKVDVAIKVGAIQAISWRLPGGKAGNMTVLIQKAAHGTHLLWSRTHDIL